MASAPAITVEDYLDVPARADALGCALGNVLTFLPDNFESAASADDFLVRGEVTTIRKVLKAGGVASAVLSAEQARPAGFVHNKSHDWAVPVLFIGSELLKTSPDLPGMAIDLIRDYATGLFTGSGKDRQAKVEIVVERSKQRSYRKISYEGDVAGLDTLAQVITELHADDTPFANR